MTEPAVYRYHGGVLHNDDWCDPSPLDVVVADSWRVEDGRVVALSRHLDRFRRSVATQASLDSPPDDLEGFLERVLEVVSDPGSWFPRIEWIRRPHGGEFRFHHRPRPHIEHSVVVHEAPHDPRTTPRVKGPDLARMNQLRALVAKEGAGEALLLDREGFLIEGAYSSLALWPKNQDTLWVVHSPLRIASITESVLHDIAEEQGVPVVSKDIHRDDVGSGELWVLSALHGIRLVTSWRNGPHVEALSSRRDRWQALWEARATPINQSG